MITTPGQAPAAPHDIVFGNGNRAQLWHQDGDPGAAGLASQLGQATGECPVIVVIGGADDLTGAALDRTRQLVGPAVSAAASRTGALVVDGGTESGVMALTGAARARAPAALPVLVGVAPAGQVSYPGSPQQGLIPLDPNHSHFLLADSDVWGGETALLFGTAQHLAAGAPVVVVLAGGGPVALSEALHAVRLGWPLLVLAGTGGLADSLLGLLAARRPAGRRRTGRGRPASGQPQPDGLADHSQREIIDAGRLHQVTGDAGQLTRQLTWELQDEPVLKSAWQEFATYDRLATRLRRGYTRSQAAILLLGVAATLLALIYTQVRSPVLHWTVVALPILVSALIAFAGRQAAGQRWVMLRAAAEAIKSEIYRYRALAAAADPRQRDKVSDQQELARRIDALAARLLQTEASSGELTPYAGPLPPPMYGAAGEDDGLSPLGPQHYIEIRIGDQLSYYHGRVRGLTRRRGLLQLLAIAAGGTGAILAAAGFDVWVGLTGGMAVAALAYLSHLQVDNTIVIFNQAANKLAGLDRGWRARTAAQQDAAAVAELVTAAEQVLTTELGGWVQQMNDAIKDLQDTRRPEAEPGRGQAV